MTGVIVGIDESPNAAAALRWAVEHGRARGEPVTALMAWAYLDQHHLHPGETFDPGYGAEEAAAALDSYVADALGAVDAVERRVVCDLPARALLDAADGASLVVLGAHGGHGHRPVLGSIPRQVLHHAPCSVAIVREHAAAPGAPIVVGVDGSDPGRRALAWALDEARRRGWPVTALHAWQPIVTGEGFLPPYLSTDALEKTVAATLDADVDAADTSDLVAPVERAVVFGRPGAALVDAAGSAALVVVGSRGRGGFAGLLLGSVSDHIARHAPGPVVVVRS